MQGDKLMRQPNYLPDRDQLLDDLDGGGDGVGGLLDDVAPGAVRITVDEYLNPQDVASPTDTELLASVCNLLLCPRRRGHLNILADKQTDTQTDKHAHHNTPPTATHFTAIAQVNVRWPHTFN